MSKTATNGGTGGIGRAGFWGIVGALAVLTLAALLLIWSGLHRAEANRVRIEATARLFAAVQSDSVSDAKTALAAGADPNGREAVDRTPLRFSLLKALPPR
jgi:type VI protein secretion system component VasK